MSDIQSRYDEQLKTLYNEAVAVWTKIGGIQDEQESALYQYSGFDLADITTKTPTLPDDDMLDEDGALSLSFEDNAPQTLVLQQSALREIRMFTQSVTFNVSQAFGQESNAEDHLDIDRVPETVMHNAGTHYPDDPETPIEFDEEMEALKKGRQLLQQSFMIGEAMDDPLAKTPDMESLLKSTRTMETMIKEIQALQDQLMGKGRTGFGER